MSKLSNYKDDEYAYYPMGLRVTEEESTRAWPVWKRGVWSGPYGTCDFSTSISTVKTTLRESTQIDFHQEGRVYWRRWPHHFGDKTIARLCREFMEEIRVKNLKARLNLLEEEIEFIKGKYAPKGAEASAMWDHLQTVGLVRNDGSDLTTDGKLFAKYV